MHSKYFIMLICTISISFSAYAQDSQSFPASWVGKWSGELVIYNAKGKAQAIPMEVNIQPIPGTRKYDWVTIYGNDTLAGKRPYTLIEKDATLGHYAIDENNNIILDAYLLGGKLFNSFEVEGQLLLCTYDLQGQSLVFEVIAGPAKPISVTGGGEAGEEKIPEVKSFSIGVLQRAVLKKQE